tara:strand:+ start:304 stop:441 length:138 start_codon:yes stop_codon:yes gene_type:complete
MIEGIYALCLAILGLTVHNMRCIHRVEKKLLHYVYENGKHELEDK